MDRPKNKVKILEGDPTQYKSFKTPVEYLHVASQAVKGNDCYTDFLG